MAARIINLMRRVSLHPNGLFQGQAVTAHSTTIVRDGGRARMHTVATYHRRREPLR